MKIKPLILLIFSPFLLFAFKNAERNQLHSTYNSFHPEIKKDSGGRTVNLDSAQACINRYTALMAAHGFSNPGGQSVNLTITKTSPLTTGESFSGKGLQDWLAATAAQYAAAGKTLMIRIQFGVYDMNYLKTYQPNPSLRAANNNRIAVFLIPYDASSGLSVKAQVAQPAGGTGSGGGTGYDFGGLQP
jgi:hypothetical protein